MEASLTPELAVAYLRELSLDVSAAVVLDASGGHLAGSVALTGPAAALLAAPEAAEGMAVRTGAGWVFGARSDTVGVVVAAGSRVLAGLMEHDVAEVVGLLSGRRPVATPTGAPREPSGTLETLADAVHRAAGRVSTLPSTDR